MEQNRRKSDRMQKRKPPWLLGGFVLILFTVLVLLQTSNLWKNLAVDSASVTLLLFALSSLNFIAFIIFAFIFLRSLLKLRQERRALKIGSKLKTRLLIYFFAVNLLPLIAMAVFSLLFMNRTLERWFTKIPENVVREAAQLQGRVAEDQKEKFKSAVAMLAKALEGKAVNSNDLQEIVDVGNFSRVEILSSNSKVLAYGEKNLSPEQSSDLQHSLSIIRQNKGSQNTLSNERKFDFAIVELSGGNILIAAVDMRLAGNLTQLANKSLREFDSLKAEQGVVQQIGFTTLGLLTFLLIFAEFWAAFYVAKGLTRPIRALAVGADEIKRGNLGYQVDAFAEDELDTLVIGFNEMSEKLGENSAELKERQKYIETVLQSLSTGVISFDDENRITTINKAAVEMFKLEGADFASLELTQIVSEENRLILERLIARAKRIGQAAEQTALQREKTDGCNEKRETLPVALLASALPNENGAVLVIEDLSELIAAQRASAWQEVARRMAHEIKNPLTPIQLSAERIAKRFSLQNGNDLKTNNEVSENVDSKGRNAKVIKEGTDTILREVLSLKSMVDEFSRFARLPDVKLENGDINELISQTAQLYQDRADDVEFEIELMDNLSSILMDDEQLKRVFVNLIDNAIEAFGESQKQKRIFIKTRADSVRDLIVAEISDNGKGVAPSDFQKLFQPYFSTKGRGTGLGLAIVQRIISEHNGKIKVVSNTPKGTKFIVELPTNV